ncbi:SDR family NAD(P)-dependent oxidoreductase [Actinophytocola sp.]|uniref:SDR family NAD(P)-dependent oxidoreductase n=1 Tax=Actinophytocola sp. TaxID=1872138 RepID=UPI002ED5FC0D
MDLGLTGRKALVTGASRGIGRAIAEVLAAEGCSLAICARGREGIDKAAAELAASGVTIVAEAVDVSDVDELRGFVATAAAGLGGLDIVVSNVSAGNTRGDGAWEASLRGDLVAFAELAAAAVPHLRRGDAAAIIAIGSTSASDTVRPAGPTPYSAMKAAVTQHAAALAQSLAPEGIRVNTVSPGPVDFPGGPWQQIRNARPEVYDEVLGKLPIGRYGAAEDIANAVAFLASPRASFVVGANLVVDGGLLHRVQL